MLVMDRTALAACAVRRAKELGVKTVVANFYPVEASPSKQIADETVDIDISNIDAMVQLIRDMQINGVFVGWTDSHLPFYAQICQKAGLPCCGTPEQFEILSNDKRRFKDACLRYGVSVPREYKLSMEFKAEDLAQIRYPVLVKPADESGSRGIRKCSNERELIENYTWLFNRSTSKKIFVEQYIESDKEIFLHYTMRDGEFSLSSGFMKHRAVSEGEVAASAILHVFGSSYIDLYREKAEPAVLDFMKQMGLKNGIVMFQGFIDGEDFYFYESGLRMGGEQFYVFAGPLNGISSLDLMIEFALTGSMGSADVLKLDNPKFSKSCVNYYVTLNPGKICAISGIEEVEQMPQVLQNATFKAIGDVIEPSNNLDRVIYRLHVMDDTPEKLAMTLERISNMLRILDEKGNEMQLEHLTYDRALEMLRNS